MLSWEEADDYFFPELEEQERTCYCEYGDCITSSDEEDYFYITLTVDLVARHLDD